MAEGDTIHRLARRIGEAMAGEAVAVRAPSPRGAAAGVARLDGGRLTRAEARGKHLLLWFEAGGEELVLHSHLAMSGSWHLHRPGDRWRYRPDSAWAVLSTATAEAVQWNGPTLRVLRPAELSRDPRLAALGPDILDPAFDVDAGVKALRRRGDRELGEALLDQTAIAGIGNIYKSESCFRARVNPWRRLGDLSDQELAAVVAATRELMLAGAGSGRMPKQVYRRAGRPCPRCRTRLRSRGQGDDARTTYWCPYCQPG
ncbi:MAG: endonuclease [Solirubrobacterales bacterium]|jgi:endonuclease-8|nr:endonuclease [Solirubrobacterales bacterium]MDX6662075.1 endonuclease [Solirubrobacterales bacterium]